jgi:DNA-binding MarR family transcriptional regulator
VSANERELMLKEVSKLLFICLYEMQRTTMQEWQSLNLSVAQLKVLLVLSFKGPLAISKVAELLHIGHPTASHLVERLVQAELAERVEDAADRRSTLARLTASGETLIQRLWQGSGERLQSSLVHLTDQDLIALREGLQAFNYAIAFQSPGELVNQERLENDISE